jgi:hypothetical protein
MTGPIADVGREQWDAFVVHASEDQASFVQALAEELGRCGVRVWYAPWSLKVGDSLREKIDAGLMSSAYGIVVLSPHFVGRPWQKRELDGLFALEELGSILLPVWHDVSFEQVRSFSPMLAGRLAISSSAGIPAVVDALSQAMRLLRPRWTHVFPSAHWGEVWMRILPAADGAEREHHVHMRWGLWTRDWTGAVRAGGRAFSFAKGDEGYAPALFVDVSPPASVGFGVGSPGDGAIDINEDWVHHT